MVLKISRIIILLTVSLILIIRIRKSKILRKKLAVILTISLCIVAFLLTMWFPIENLFIEFSTPEQAFNYGGIGEIQSIDYGKNSCMVVYSQNNDSLASYIIPKHGNGYKLPTQFDQKIVNVVLSKYGNIQVYSLAGTGDYYFIGVSTSNSKEINISDSSASKIKYTVKSNNVSDDKTIIYHSYVENYSNLYYILFNGNKIEMTSKH